MWCSVQTAERAAPAGRVCRITTTGANPPLFKHMRAVATATTDTACVVAILVRAVPFRVIGYPNTVQCVNASARWCEY